MKWPKKINWERLTLFYKQHRRASIALGLALAIILLWILPPAAFPKGRIIRIQKGMTVAEIGNYLEEKKVVQSELLFTGLIKLLPGDPKIIAGDYMLGRRLTVFEVMYRLLTGSYDIEPIRVLIPEGAKVTDISIILAKRLPEFKQKEFLLLASTSQGYLFPDTYFFLPTASTSALIDEMHENFNRHIDPLRLAIFKSKRSLDEIIKMASILEKEAHIYADREMISGILWKRFDQNVRLQVDVATETYKKSGLPVKPIANPGLESIKAALEPVESEYWFYLADRKGVTHYAVTYKEHLKNIAKYLK
jgi:UPF0755 protein